MQQWEFCHVIRNLNGSGLIFYYSTAQTIQENGASEAIKLLGLEGWELVSVVAFTYEMGFYFKRPL